MDALPINWANGRYDGLACCRSIDDVLHLGQPETGGRSCCDVTGVEKAAGIAMAPALDAMGVLEALRAEMEA